ncbi:MAG TPA: capsule biosynthesis protein [Fibrobacteria bacterium]|nr:capsule biosynthesis protein [Fibrobacteria bacterium]
MFGDLAAAWKDFLKSNPTVHRNVKYLKRQYYARKNAYPPWKSILSHDAEGWRKASVSVPSAPKILFATSISGLHTMVSIESALGAALTLRGAEVHVLLCDEALPACMDCDTHWFPDHERMAKDGPKSILCGSCFRFGRKTFEALGFRVHRYSDHLGPQDTAEAARIARETPYRDIASFQWEGLAVGEHSLAGALRFFARATLGDEPQGEAVLRRYFEAGLLTAITSRRLLRSAPFTCAVFHHGIYIPQGVIGEVARQEKVRVVNWNPAYRKQCFLFSHYDTYHHTLMTEPTGNWENVEMAPELEEDLMKYLRSRWQGTEDWIWFHEKPQFDLEKISRETGVDFSKPCIGMLTNVMWDAQLHYPANAFGNMLEWTLETIAYFAKRPDLQLLVRIHPAEIRANLKSRQPILEEICRAYPELPKNVFVIPPESQVSTYAAMYQCDSVIIYGTKTGVELTSMGVPVIVAGEAWIRNKGVTLDASSRADYTRILDGLPLGHKLDESQIKRARKYAFHFFFRRMIPLRFVQQGQGWVPFKVPDMEWKALLPGRDPGLDVVCRGILEGTDFIYPAEALLKPSKAPAVA